MDRIRAHAKREPKTIRKDPFHVVPANKIGDIIQKVYLASYDRYDEVLEYDTATGLSRLLTRSGFALLDVPVGFGRFIREEEHVLGVFASPRGPIFFVDTQRVPGQFGEISASVVPAADGKRRFTLWERGQSKLYFHYRERHGIGTNPYDNEPEDVDLGSMLAAGIRNEQFFKNYTRDWAPARGAAASS